MSDPLPVWFAVQAELLGHDEELDSQSSRSCFDCYDDATLFELFHLTRACVEFVADIVRVRMKKFLLTSLSLDAMIMVTLNFYARGSHSAALMKRFNLKTDCEDIVFTVSEVVAGMSDQFISFPQTRKAKIDMAHMVEDFCGIPDVLGLLAPAHFKISQGEFELCVNSLGYASVVSQMICDLDGNILSVEQCCAGGTCEQDLWATSFRGREIEEQLYGQYWVIGGEGYDLSKRVLTPVSEPKDEAQRNFNAAHAKIHEVTRHTLRSLKWRFRCLTHLGFAQHKLTNVIKACCVLHNIAKKFSVSLPYGEEMFVDTQPSNPRTGSAEICPNALKARQELIDYHFTVIPTQEEPE
ncbi:putative nuclease HARBI1 [Phyllopteryx taeniolatus]|uniref:putative nuclease HARBI1 n=1 Tax=Phyllopteryx taeniolatus TaxID=161469 RepID=UPI002AD46A48|nr:putative nuclease HARBI1 [Phyllopteryx taeniolatus]